MIILLIAVPLIVHGLANTAGFFDAWTRSTAPVLSDRPWLFSSGVTVHSQTGRAWGVLWLVSAIALVLGGVAVLLHMEAWRALTILGAAASIAAIVPWWRSVPPGARFAVVFDLVLIGVLLAPFPNPFPQIVH